MRQEQDWKARESGILALGAISEGCASGLLHYLTDMVTALLPLLTDSRPLVRSITCWALSRYSRWIVDKGREPHSQGQRQMEAVIQVQPPPFVLLECGTPRSSVLCGSCHLVTDDTDQNQITIC